MKVLQKGNLKWLNTSSCSIEVSLSMLDNIPIEIGYYKKCVEILFVFS